MNKILIQYLTMGAIHFFRSFINYKGVHLSVTTTCNLYFVSGTAEANNLT